MNFDDMAMPTAKDDGFSPFTEGFFPTHVDYTRQLAERQMDEGTKWCMDRVVRNSAAQRNRQSNIVLNTRRESRLETRENHNSHNLLYLLCTLHKALEALRPSLKREYLEALSTVPELVQLESPKILFSCARPFIPSRRQ
jgi:hypothetical protein